MTLMVIKPIDWMRAHTHLSVMDTLFQSQLVRKQQHSFPIKSHKTLANLVRFNGWLTIKHFWLTSPDNFEATFILGSALGSMLGNSSSSKKLSGVANLLFRSGYHEECCKQHFKLRISVALRRFFQKCTICMKHWDSMRHFLSMGIWPLSACAVKHKLE